MSKTPPGSKPDRDRPKGRREEGVASRYEGGHGAPFSPVTPETAAPHSPAVEEMRSRDQQDGKAEARRERRKDGSAADGPPEPEDSPASATGPDAVKSMPKGKPRQRRSHRTLH
jgi:hypothetical protein